MIVSCRCWESRMEIIDHIRPHTGWTLGIWMPALTDMSSAHIKVETESEEQIPRHQERGYEWLVQSLGTQGGREMAMFWSWGLTDIQFLASKELYRFFDWADSCIDGMCMVVTLLKTSVRQLGDKYRRLYCQRSNKPENNYHFMYLFSKQFTKC